MGGGDAGWWCGEYDYRGVVTRRLGATRAEGRYEPRTATSGRLGSGLVGPPGGRHLRRLAEPPEHRRRPRRVHVRVSLRRLRHRVPVLDLAAAAADADVLAARVAGVLEARPPM